MFVVIFNNLNFPLLFWFNQQPSSNMDDSGFFSIQVWINVLHYNYSLDYESNIIDQLIFWLIDWLIHRVSDWIG